MNSEKVDYLSILRKCVEKEATMEEVRLLENWLADHENSGLFADFLRSEWTQFVKEDSEDIPRLNAVLDSINKSIDNELVNSSSEKTQAKLKKTKWSVLSGMAASLIIAAVYVGTQTISTEPIENTFPKTITETKLNPKGQKSVIVLRDGSRVKLNADSQLSFPETFEDDKRIVYLKGEAFFEVARDINRPFTVVTENISTTALGTSFNVRAFPDQREIEIVLATGKVSVSHTGFDSIASQSSVVLDPHFRATFAKDKQSLVKDSIDYTEQLAWRDGILYFNDASLMEITQKLERWYNVEIDVRNSQRWGDRQFTGNFDNESLKNVIDGISFSSRFKYEINGRKILIIL